MSGYTECNHTFPPIRKIVSAVIKAREARQELAAALSNIEWGFRDGDGSDASHYALLASEGEFQMNSYPSANAAAKTVYDEAASLYGKLNAMTGQGDETGVAINKLAGFLGV